MLRLLLRVKKWNILKLHLMVRPRTYAQELGLTQVQQLLQQTLDEKEHGGPGTNGHSRAKSQSARNVGFRCGWQYIDVCFRYYIKVPVTGKMLFGKSMVLNRRGFFIYDDLWKSGYSNKESARSFNQKQQNDTGYTRRIMQKINRLPFSLYFIY